MGGGDLNMKKHFHPLTMENLERVWKAEEKKRLEEEKVKQLTEELRQERQREDLQRQAVESGLVKKKTEKLDWMYSHAQTVNAEAYLLGKKIDKNVDSMKDDEKKVDIVSTQKVSAPKASDILAKVKEDPLFLIKKKEEENRKELVQNPIRMKKIRVMLEEKVTQELKKKSKKSKKKNRKRHRRSSSDERSLSPKRDKIRRRELSSSDERDIHRKKHKYSGEGSRKLDDSENKNKNNHQKRLVYGDDRRRIERDDRHPRTKYDRHNGDRFDKNGSRKKYEVEDRASHHKRRKKHSTSSSEDSKSDSDDKMELKRQEMLKNAEWRQKQRLKNYDEFKKEKSSEEKMKMSRDKTNVVEDKAAFIKKLQVAAYSSKDTSSVEDRIRRTIHSKQRTNASLDKKFTVR